MNELYKKYRPTTLQEVVGNVEAVNALRSMIGAGNVPHALLISGPSGNGKTTLARILKSELNCGDMDFTELNAADARGIDTVREIRKSMYYHPINGDVKIYLIDEAHKLTTDAQTAILKMLEDTPKRVYFVLATTDEQKLIPTVRNRCTELKVRSLAPDERKELIERTLTEEQADLPDEVIERLGEVCEGSARRLMVLLEQVLALEDKDQQLKILLSNSVKEQAINLARALMNPQSKWTEVSNILNNLGEDEEPEKLRYMVLGYATKVLLGGGKMQARARMVIMAFQDNFYDSKRAGLVAACYDVYSSK